MQKNRIYSASIICMDTLVTIKIVTSYSERTVEEGMERVWGAFRHVEAVCSRFDPQSELRQLCRQIGTPVPVSPLLFEALHFAWEVAELTQGVFDPTVGQTMERRGFNRNYSTGQRIPCESGLGNTIEMLAADSGHSTSYRDVRLDDELRTVELLKPVVLDLGAVAKGLAIDLAKRELEPFGHYMINAGGDLYVSGHNERDELWRVGVRHPLHKDQSVGWMSLTNTAVCTSGSYERPMSQTSQTSQTSEREQKEHHLLNPLTSRSPDGALSCTVIAPYAMMADAFSTAAFVLGAEKGIALLDSLELPGLMITPELTTIMTREMRALWHESTS